MLSACAVADSEGRGQLVQKETFLRLNLPGREISDIAECVLTNGHKQLIILAREKCVVLKEDEGKPEEFSSRMCPDAKVWQFPNDKCMAYCRGSGFGRVYLADLTGKIYWELSKPTRGTIWRAVATPSGSFYVGSNKGTKLLSRDGRILREFPVKVTKIEYFATAPLVTLTQHGLSNQTLDVRDLQLETISSFPMKEAINSIVMFDWPEKGAICYTTPDDFVCLNSKGRELRRVPLGKHPVTGAFASVVHTGNGDSYLGLLALYREPKKRWSQLLIFSPQFRKIYEATLPLSIAITTLKWKSDHERLFVGVGSTGVDAYSISDGK